MPCYYLITSLDFSRATKQPCAELQGPFHSLRHLHTHPLTRNPPPPRHPPHAHAVAETVSDSRLSHSRKQRASWCLARPASPPPPPMSLSSFSSLSSYSSESDVSLSTVFDFGFFKTTSTSRARRKRPRAEPSSRPRLKDTDTDTRRRKRSVTPTRTPVSSRYDADRAAVVPYSHGLRSPGSKSGISYSDIDRWRATTIGGSDFTYSSTSSISQSSVTTSSVVTSSRTRSSRVDASSRRSTVSASRKPIAPSVPPQHPQPGFRHDPPQICEHCRTPFICSCFRYPLDGLILFPAYNRSATTSNSRPHGCAPSPPTRTSLCLPCCLSPLSPLLSRSP